MIVVDTNVISEPLRKAPSPRVLEWLEREGPGLLLTSITIAELLDGVERLPRGSRRTSLAKAVERLVRSATQRPLDFDVEAARVYAELRSRRDQMGRPAAAEDLMIGAICAAHGLPLATRNTRDFEDLGIELIDPWG